MENEDVIVQRQDEVRIFANAAGRITIMQVADNSDPVAIVIPAEFAQAASMRLLECALKIGSRRTQMVRQEIPE